MKKKVIELQIGDRVELEDGTIVPIRRIDNGIYRNSKLLTYSNGKWSCLLNTDIITVVI